MTLLDSNLQDLKPHYWFGQWINDAQLRHHLEHDLTMQLCGTLAKKFPFEHLLTACQALAEDLHSYGESAQRLDQYIVNALGEQNSKDVLSQLHSMLQKDYLQTKLRAELGTDRPNQLERRYPEREYEMWAPLGCIVHVMPSNVFAVAALGLLEGLLSNNINIVKLSARDTPFAAIFAEELVRYDATQELQHYIAVLRLASQQTDTLEHIFKYADAISAWGGENAIKAIRKMAPHNTKIIAWGHKVSFGYLAAEKVDDDQVLEAFARDICRLDQQACSSPQTIFVEVTQARLIEVGQRLANLMPRVSPTIVAEQPDLAASAEITTVLNVAKAEQALGLTHVFISEQSDWRIIVDFRPGLKPSPLYRTIWLKPIQRDQIISTLRPMRAWLQTCGLAAGFPDAAWISQQLLAAGVTRVTLAGQMIDSYNGAPHDGVYALQQMMRRVSVDVNDDFAKIGSFSQLIPTAQQNFQHHPVMHKEQFQQLAVNNKDPNIGLIVRSGGSSGKTAYSQFRWTDYYKQMHETSHGLVAAGLNPKQDVVMNLFAAGYMYGSFISFWTILEHLGVRQIPMAMVMEYDLILEEIIQQEVTVLVGMTPHLLALFSAEKDRLKHYGKLKKVYYGGEGLSTAQKDFLTRQCGIEIVRSVTYGSNDAGPMGYQCEHSTGGIHHLFSNLQQLEILKLDVDEPVEDGEVGRLIFSSRARTSPEVLRYEIGDLGRWVNDDCECGRKDARFELMGRLGDVFKAGGPFLNYASFVKILSEFYQYAGPLQIHIDTEQEFTCIHIWVNSTLIQPKDEVVEALFEHYSELNMCRVLKMPMKVFVEIHHDDDFERVKASGKIKHICDHRVG